MEGSKEPQHVNTLCRIFMRSSQRSAASFQKVFAAWFSSSIAASPTDFGLPLTVDTPEDLEFMREVYTLNGRDDFTGRKF